MKRKVFIEVESPEITEAYNFQPEVALCLRTHAHMLEKPGVEATGEYVDKLTDCKVSWQCITIYHSRDIQNEHDS